MMKLFLNRILAASACLFLAFGGSGCGYTRQSVLPQGIKTIYVATVKNEIPIERVNVYQPGLEMMITNAVTRRLERDGNLKVVPEEQADAVLESSLTNFEQEGLRFTSLESVEEYRFFVVLSMKLVNRKTGDIFWQEPNFSGDAEYFVNTVRSISREEAAQRAVERLARNVVDRIVEDW